ncbi:MAG: hypothetical protein KTQ13_06030 [Ferruginibacter sp.]|nr:hypothetical protein [Chitinophagaceae bacterium]MBP6285594.1 hypothetical protein [Ferruginibacter sp.]MBU9936192.1 hypothetical protein [Ferruginibacter sp.]HQY10909.1 hypothetical protein [Ferruginibacter sp.]
MQNIYGTASRTRGYFIGMAPPVTGAVSNGPAFKFSGLDISSTKSVQ